MKEKSMGVPELSRAKMITLTLCFFLVFFIDLIDGNLLISPRKCL